MHDWRNRTFDILIRDMKLAGRFKSVADLGCGNQYFKQRLKPERYVSVGLATYEEDNLTGNGPRNENSIDRPDVDFNLDTDKRYPFRDREFDLVIASQIFEHLHRLEHAVEEAKRICRSHILVGLPNDMRIDVRLRMLLGTNPIDVARYGHCWMFDAHNSGSFIRQQFLRDGYELEGKLLIYTGTGELHMPQKLRLLLPKLSENLFAGQLYYLLRKK